MNDMRFVKRVFNAEDGTRTLAFYRPSVLDVPPRQPIPASEIFILFNLNVLEDERCELGSFNFAMTMKQRLELAMGFNLSAAELEHAVDGI